MHSSFSFCQKFLKITTVIRFISPLKQRIHNWKSFFDFKQINHKVLDIFTIKIQSYLNHRLKLS